MSLISKEDLLTKINAYMVYSPDVDMVIKLINELPIIEISLPGKWIEDTGLYATCSNCKENLYQAIEYKFCPNCGSKMEDRR